MTGIEQSIIAGKVLGSAAKAAAEDPKEREVLRELAMESGALNPAARAYAKRLAVKEQIRMKIWQPLGMLFGISRDYFENDFADDMADRIARIPEDQLITPRLSVAGPSVQGIAFTIAEPELKAMYLNLLAAAADKRVANSAHPSFAEIIRQISTEEAVVLGPVLQQSTHAIVEIRVKAATVDQPEESGFITSDRNIMNWTNQGTQFAAPERALYIDNWERLGLIKVAFDTFLTDPTAYAWTESQPQVIIAREEFDTEEFKRIECQPGYLMVTDFGRAFYQMVIAPRLD